MPTSQIDYPQPTVSQPDADTLRVTFGDQPTAGSRLSPNQVLAALLAENIRTNSSGGGGGGAVTVADGADVALGARADAAAATDAGTFSLISLFKRLLGKLPAAIGQGTITTSFPVVIASNQTSVATGGNVASGGTDSGNPLKIGGVYSATLPTVTTGQRVNAQMTNRGELLTASHDFVTAAANISAADVGSASAVGANGQVILTGTPTANSVVSTSGTGNSSFAIQVSGTWVGTLQFERSLDNGSTWTAVNAFTAGTNFVTQTTTANGNYNGNASSSTGIRIRATAWTSGTASIILVFGSGTGATTIINPLRLVDGAFSTVATIKAASTAPVAADTALVVAVSPNTPTLPVSGRTRSLVDTISGSTTPAYSIDDFVGTGGTVATQNLLFAGAFSGAGAGATLTNFIVWTTGSLPLSIVVYRKPPTVVQTDNAAFAPGVDTDAIVDRIDLSTPRQAGALYSSRLSEQVSIQSSAASGTADCYIGLIANGAGTLGAGTIQAVASFLPD